MDTHKQPLGAAALAKIVKNKPPVNSLTTLKNLESKKLQLANYFTSKVQCFPRETQQKPMFFNQRSSVLESVRLGPGNPKQSALELSQDFLSSNQFVSRRTSNALNNACLKSALTYGSNLLKQPKTGSVSTLKREGRQLQNRSQDHPKKAFLKSNNRTQIEFLDAKQSIKSKHSPINIFNIKNCTVLADNDKKGHKRSLSHLGDNLALLRQSKLLPHGSTQLFNGAKRMPKRQRSITLAENQVFNREYFAEQFEKPIAKKISVDKIHHRKSSSLAGNSFQNFESKIKYARLGALIDKLTAQTPTQSDAAVQKNKKRFHQVNYMSTNIDTLLKDISKEKLFKKLTNKSGSPERKSPQPKVENSPNMKMQIIREILSMNQEQLFFEELLLILGERGVDVENLFAYCYERMKIDITDTSDAQKTANKLLSESHSCLGSEVSVLENASAVLLRKVELCNSRKKLKLDMRKVKRDVLSSQEENFHS